MKWFPVFVSQDSFTRSNRWAMMASIPRACDIQWCLTALAVMKTWYSPLVGTVDVRSNPGHGSYLFVRTLINNRIDESNPSVYCPDYVHVVTRSAAGKSLWKSKWASWNRTQMLFGTLNNSFFTYGIISLPVMLHILLFFYLFCFPRCTDLLEYYSCSTTKFFHKLRSNTVHSSSIVFEKLWRDPR